MSLMKSVRTERHYLQSMLDFYVSTAVWLNNLAICSDEVEAGESFFRMEAILKGSEQTPTASRDDSDRSEEPIQPVNKCLTWVPEFIIKRRDRVLN